MVGPHTPVTCAPASVASWTAAQPTAPEAPYTSTLDAAVPVTLAYTLPLDVIPGLAGSLWLVTFLALQIITNIYFARASLWKTLIQAHHDDEHEDRANQPLASSSPHVQSTGSTCRARLASPATAQTPVRRHRWTR